MDRIILGANLESDIGELPNLRIMEFSNLIFNVKSLNGILV